MPNPLGGYSIPGPLDPEHRKHIQKYISGAWSFWCQGCDKKYTIHEVSEAAMREKAERFGFVPSGDSYKCEECK